MGHWFDSRHFKKWIRINLKSELDLERVLRTSWEQGLATWLISCPFAQPSASGLQSPVDRFARFSKICGIFLAPAKIPLVPSINYVTRISWFLYPSPVLVLGGHISETSPTKCDVTFCNFTSRNFKIKTAVPKLFLFPFKLLLNKINIKSNIGMKMTVFTFMIFFINIFITFSETTISWQGGREV